MPRTRSSLLAAILGAQEVPLMGLRFCFHEENAMLLGLLEVELGRPLRASKEKRVLYVGL